MASDVTKSYKNYIAEAVSEVKKIMSNSLQKGNYIGIITGTNKTYTALYIKIETITPKFLEDGDPYDVSVSGTGAEINYENGEITGGTVGAITCDSLFTGLTASPADDPIVELISYEDFAMRVNELTSSVLKK